MRPCIETAPTTPLKSEEALSDCDQETSKNAKIS
jgi:hypothetical protein